MFVGSLEMTFQLVLNARSMSAFDDVLNLYGLSTVDIPGLVKLFEHPG